MSIFEKVKGDYKELFPDIKKLGDIRISEEERESWIHTLDIKYKRNGLLHVYCYVIHDRAQNKPSYKKEVWLMRPSFKPHKTDKGTVWLPDKNDKELVREYYYAPTCVGSFELEVKIYDNPESSMREFYKLMLFLKNGKTKITYKEYIKIKKAAYSIVRNFNYDKYKVDKNPVKNLESKTYIIKDKNTGFYKIGKSINPMNREKTLQGEKPTLKMIKVFDKDIEKELHEKYFRQRLRGEWFELNKFQVRYICTHY